MNCCDCNRIFFFPIAWFRIVQTIVVLTLIVNIAAVFMLSFYPIDILRIKYYNPNRYRAFLVNSILMFVSSKAHQERDVVSLLST
jgi:hypothetical protein